MRMADIRRSVGKVRRETVAMGGLNWSDRLADGDLAYSKGVSLRRWPYLATRQARAEQAGYTDCTALYAWNKLVAVDGTDLLYDGKKVGQVTEGAKQFAVLNTKLVIWPDRVYFDLQDNKVVPLGASMTLEAGTAAFTSDAITSGDKVKVGSDIRVGHWVQPEGGDDWLAGFHAFRITKLAWSKDSGWSKAEYEEVAITNLHMGDLLMTDRSGKVIVYEYETGRNDSGTYDGTPDSFHREGIYAAISSLDGMRYAPGLGQSYIKFYVDTYRVVNNGSFTDHFKVGDTVTVAGAGVNNKEAAAIVAVEANKLTFAANSFTPAENTSLQVTVSRGIPAMDFICESDNRLWGCSSSTQTIYASALGDPTNFHTVAGLSTDSYASAVGSEGSFTGCCKLGSSVLFWKEHKLHKVMGSYPAEYAVYSYDMEGLKAGCHKSMRILNETLYYVGTQGVCAYSGGSTAVISRCFGGEELEDAVGGTDGGQYYLSARDRAGTWRLLVYDPALGLWVQEDDLRCRDFARVGRTLYFADGAGKVFAAEGGEDDGAVEWTVQFAPFYETVEGKKRYSRLLLRTELPAGSWLAAEVRCDRGPWRECGRVVGRRSGVTAMRIAVTRCDRFELRLRGKGPCTVLSMLREFSVGSEV